MTEVIFLHRMTMVTALNYPIKKSLYTDPNIFMVYWWGIYSYFNNEQIQIGDIEILKL